MNHRARVDRVAVGRVAAGGVDVDGGSVVGVGDQGRDAPQPERACDATGRGELKNGYGWTVTKAHRDGQKLRAANSRRADFASHTSLSAD